MAFLKRHKDEELSFPFRGSTGYRIKKYRELRGMSQQELGVKCGFPVKSAALRIRQYETNKQIPRDKELLKIIANALGMNEKAIFDLDLSSGEQVYPLMFELEDLYGLRPCYKDGFYYLRFDYEEGESWKQYNEKIYPFLKDWYEMRVKCLPDDNDSEETKKEKIRSYTIWKGEYPIQVNRKKQENQSVAYRMAELQMEMDNLNTVKEESIQRYNEVKRKAKELITKVAPKFQSIKKTSDLLVFIIDMMEQGLEIKGRKIDGRFESVRPGLENGLDLLSVAIKEIENPEGIVNYAKVAYVMKSLKDLGISITERLTSLNNELFITYSYPFSESNWFEKIDEAWDEMMGIMNDGRNNKYDGHYKQMRNSFLERFRKDNDIVLTE